MAHHRRGRNLDPVGHALIWLAVLVVTWWIGNKVEKKIGGPAGVVVGAFLSYEISHAIENA